MHIMEYHRANNHLSQERQHLREIIRKKGKTKLRGDDLASCRHINVQHCTQAHSPSTAHRGPPCLLETQNLLSPAMLGGAEGGPPPGRMGCRRETCRAGPYFPERSRPLVTLVGNVDGASGTCSRRRVLSWEPLPRRDGPPPSQPVG